MKITVLGAGAWGTALARMLAARKHEVTLWDHFPETVEAICQTGRNERYLPGIELPAGLQAEADAAKAVGNAAGNSIQFKNNFFPIFVPAIQPYVNTLIPVGKINTGLRCCISCIEINLCNGIVVMVGFFL